MNRFRFSHVVIVGALIVALAASAVVVSTTRTPVTEAQGDDGIPPEVASNVTAWPLANFDYHNTRNTTHSTITSANVGTLGVAWQGTGFTPATSGALATNPLVLDDVVYAQDLMNNVIAFDFDDGTELWRYEAGVENIGPNGVGVGYGRAYFTVNPEEIVAVSLEDGSEVWRSNIRTQNDSEGIDIQSTVYNGLVYVSTVPGNSNENFYAGGVGGILYALDADTGEVVWSWQTVEEGLWGNPDVNSGGGAWFPPAVDVETGITFWSIANPAPWPGTEEFPNTSSRPGDNLWTNSLVAIDAMTGELLWYNQVLPHDRFDLDLHLSPILATTAVNDLERDVVFTAGKMGTVYAIDRATGDLLWATDVGIHKNDRIEKVPEDTEIEVLPGALGGVETPMAFADGMIYAPYLNLATFYTPSTFRLADFGTATGGLAAIDANTGAILWEAEYQAANFGAATVINDLVFTATFDGKVYAYDKLTGDEVWSWQAPAGINGSMAAVGDTLLVPAGLGENAGLFALRLGLAEEETEGDMDGEGDMEDDDAADGDMDDSDMDDGDMDDGDMDDGDMDDGDMDDGDMDDGDAADGDDAAVDTSGIDAAAVLQESCSACHSPDRVESAAKDADAWASTIDRMIGYGADLTDAERAALIEYLTANYGPDNPNAGGGP